MPEPAPPPVASIRCDARVAERTVVCDAPLAGGARADRILGGQNVNVKLTSSNVTYDAGTGVFGFDVTVQNLLVQRMGTPDGTTLTGIRVFFAADPSTTAGSGAVEVRNADGVGIFTASGQPYFHYAGTLGHQEVSAPRRWNLTVPSSVTSFGFTLYLSTELLPVVVFDGTLAGNRDIFRVGLDGSDLTRLTTSLGDDRDPTVVNGRIVFTSYRDGNAELYSIPLAGGAETRLTTSTQNETDPALSPDGTRLAFARAPSGGMTRLYTAASDATGATLANASAPGSVIEGGPTWESSTRLAYTSTEAGSADIWAWTAGGVRARLAWSGSADVEAAWNHDGTRLAFATNRDGDTELYLYTAATGVSTRLTTRAGDDGGPTWLRDGRIVFVCYAAGAGRLCWVDPAAPGVITLIPMASANARNPAAVVF